MEDEDTVKSLYEETSRMKGRAPQCQGTDAALEQLIKRSKKGAKIQVCKTDWPVQSRTWRAHTEVAGYSGRCGQSHV